MFIGEWKAQLIVDPPGIAGAVLYMYRRLDAEHNEFLCANGTIIKTPRNGTPVNTDLSFAVLETEQLRAVAEAFSNSGVKTVNEHKISGLLEAKDAHLQDMRRIVFREEEKDA